MSRAIRSSRGGRPRLDPTGSRTDTWNRDSSSAGVKLMPEARNSGTIEAMTITETPTITQRCAIEKVSIHV